MFTPVFRLERIQRLPLDLSECWSFFSSPMNLPKITPPWLGFDVDPIERPQMYPGMMLKYYVTPLAGIRMRWVTEITYVDEPFYFVDEQRLGPYRMWHHEHHFRAIEQGVEMKDIVHYAVPLGPLGGVINRLMVARRVNEIFDYRVRTLTQIFGTVAGETVEPMSSNA